MRVGEHRRHFALAAIPLSAHALVHVRCTQTIQLYRRGSQ
jgi:hypothetical protein